MSNVTLSMKMSPKATGALFSKACRLEDEIEQLRARVAELECMVMVFRGCTETGLLPEKTSPCMHKVFELVGARVEEGSGGER
ncbi:MAG: hypothetical protein ACTHWH_05875 [Marinobacter sp.]